jgi:hypothetical protein
MKDQRMSASACRILLRAKQRRNFAAASLDTAVRTVLHADTVNTADSG